MKNFVILVFLSVFSFTTLFAQTNKLQIILQTSFAIPTGLFASGYEAYSIHG
jgi:hypothetical protein